jgi:hypothetical protein
VLAPHHQDNWEQSCRQVGARVLGITAEDLLQHWNLDVLVSSEILKVQ